MPSQGTRVFFLFFFLLFIFIFPAYKGSRNPLGRLRPWRRPPRAVHAAPHLGLWDAPAWVEALRPLLAPSAPAGMGRARSPDSPRVLWAWATRFVESGQVVPDGAALRLRCLPTRPSHLRGLTRKPCTRGFLCCPTRGRSGRGQSAHTNSPSRRTSPAAPRARARLRGAGLGAAALLEPREQRRRPRRTWLAQSQARRAGATESLGVIVTPLPSGPLP